jgi:hypothetical protein
VSVGANGHTPAPERQHAARSAYRVSVTDGAPLTGAELGLVVALGSPQTGPIEKAVVAPAIVGLLAAGVPVRRIGSQA